ncbi:MAG: cysteine peptidase family C39 domain-containing protein [Vicinamibacterales bacterium]
MTTPDRHRYILPVFLTAAVALATAAASPPARAQGTPPTAPLLDVPYLPQSEALCGGAAIAMVMRYWGATGIYAETFAELLDVEAQGIRGRDLIRALEARDYETASFEGNLDQIRRALDSRRPAVALIEDRPSRFHYVVIVGLRGDRIVIHDPARAPFRVIDTEDFLRAWAQTGYWMLVARPRLNVSAGPVMNPPEPVTDDSNFSSVCAGMVDEGVRLSGRGDLAAAERVLKLAAGECAHDPAPWRELAGVHALRGEWSQAATTARQALERDLLDQHATRTLATSLFLAGEPERALDAWNRIEAPVVDLVEIRGLEQTRYAVAADALHLVPQTLLTRGRLERARRRLDALPSLIGSRVAYEPDEGDRAKVAAAVVERSVVPAGLVPLTAMAMRSVSDRELRVNVAGPTGGGELWSAAWRWWERRPRGELGVSAPLPLGGVWSVLGFAERQSYGFSGSPISERRRGVSLSGSDWPTGSTRIQGGVSFDRWSNGMSTSLAAGVGRSFDSGRGIAALEGTVFRGAFRTALLAAQGEWQSAAERVGPVWHLRAGLATAGSQAPLALWPGAGAGQGRDVLLRAHPLLHDGVIRGVFGRRLSHGGVEWRYWRGTILRTLRVAPAGFVDVARAERVPVFGDDRAHVDAGLGVRIAVPGAGVLRIDLAKGLRDGQTGLSIGWTR